MQPTIEIPRQGHARDGITVWPDRVVIHQRTLGNADVSIPRAELTEYRSAGSWALDGRGYRIHLRAGSKKYVVRRMKKDEAAGVVAALNGAP